MQPAKSTWRVSPGMTNTLLVSTVIGSMVMAKIAKMESTAKDFSIR
jgi:hypothetical protein